LDGISQFLEGIAPDISVVISDDLCQEPAILNIKRYSGKKPLIIGACTQLKYTPYFRENFSDNLWPSYPVAIVDLLTDNSALFDDEVNLERVKLILWSQIKRMSTFHSVERSNLKLCFSIPHEKLSRRQFLTTTLPRYEIIPFIDQSKCRGADKCGLCSGSCPSNAVSITQTKVVIDNNKCSACCACLVLCPHNAIYFPTFSLEELDSELEGLLYKQDCNLEPRIIAFVCEPCLSMIADNIEYPASVLPLKVPCLATVAPWLMLKAFDAGCEGLVLITGEGKCYREAAHAIWEQNIDFVKSLLDCWQIEPERFMAVQVSEDNDKTLKLFKDLERYADKISQLGSTPFKFYESTNIPDNMLKLPVLVQEMKCRTMSSGSGTVTAGNVPFGKLMINNHQCTFCGLCAVSCPTDALTIETGEDAVGCQLLFKQSVCVGCGKCVDLCPESCLQLQRILELDRICNDAYELLYDSIVSCRRCGRQVAPKSMILHLKKKLESSNHVLLEQLELCNSCKTEVPYSKTVVSVNSR